MWWNNVETKPGMGCPTGWDDQELPWGVELHIVNAYLFISFFPFTRLVHVLVIPNPYLWCKPQVVRWARRAS